MKIVIYVLTGIAVVIAVTFLFLVYRLQINKETPAATETPIVEETETDIAKRILVGQLETSQMTPEEKNRAEESARQQIDDDARLYEMAVAAGTVIPDSIWQFNWLREVYNHTDEAGLAAYIASLGLTEEEYRALVKRRLMVATFIETKAAARVTDNDVRTYYEALPTDERDDFALMEIDIRENLQAKALADVRQELLAQ